MIKKIWIYVVDFSKKMLAKVRKKIPQTNKILDGNDLKNRFLKNQGRGRIVLFAVVIVGLLSPFASRFFSRHLFKAVLTSPATPPFFAQNLPSFVCSDVENHESKETPLLAGDLILTRNTPRLGKNATPGYWNHVGIVSTDGAHVIEAQRSFHGKLIVTRGAFLTRYPEYRVLRKDDPDVAFRAALQAERQLNDAAFYGAFVSLSPFLTEYGRANNCVSLVRRAYLAATGIDYRWQTPDQIYRQRHWHGFDIVESFEKRH